MAKSLIFCFLGGLEFGVGGVERKKKAEKDCAEDDHVSDTMPFLSPKSVRNFKLSHFLRSKKKCDLVVLVHILFCDGLKYYDLKIKLTFCGFLSCC